MRAESNLSPFFMTSKIRIFFLIVLFCLTIFAVSHKKDFLLVSGDGRTVKVFTIYPGKVFQLSYIHSVEKTEIVEIYKISNDHKIILDSIIFESLGAGLPFELPEVKFERRGDKFNYSGINREIEAIRVIPVKINEYELEIDKKRIYLLDMVESGKVINIEIKKISLIYFLINFFKDMLIRR